MRLRTISFVLALLWCSTASAHWWAVPSCHSRRSVYIAPPVRYYVPTFTANPLQYKYKGKSNYARQSRVKWAQQQREKERQRREERRKDILDKMARDQRFGG